MLLRKCANCGGEIQVSLPYSGKYVHYKNKWLCADCFTVITTPKILKNDWFGKTKTYVIQEVSKDNIDKYFKTHYDLSFIPTYIYIKLDSIYKGTLKGIAQPIPPNELLDILEKKQSYIDQCISTKKIDGINKVNYALAVAIGSYKSYKAWLLKVKAEQEEAKRQSNYLKQWGDTFKAKGYIPENKPSDEVDFSEIYTDND